MKYSSVTTDGYTTKTDGITEEYNTDNYMLLYSSVPKNIRVYSSVILTDKYIRIYSSVTRIRRIYYPSCAPATCPYIPRLTEQHNAIRSSVN
jgi:hypothetical protein